MKRRDLGTVLFSNFLNLSLGDFLLSFAPVVDHLLGLHIPLDVDALCILHSLLLKSVFAVHLVLEKLIVFAVVLLNVCGQLLGVGFLQSLNSFVIVFEVLELFFVFLTPVIEAFLHVLEVHFHIGTLVAVLLLDLVRFMLLLSLEGVELALAFTPLFQMLGFELFNFLFEFGSLLCFDQVRRLFRNN